MDMSENYFNVSNWCILLVNAVKMSNNEVSDKVQINKWTMFN